MLSQETLLTIPRGRVLRAADRECIVAGDYESRSISVLKPRGHYQQIMNENLSVPRVLSRSTVSHSLHNCF